MNPFGSNKELAENKLILLYIIDKIDMPLNNLQITKLILENRFMNYFLLQQFLNELHKGGFLLSETIEGKNVYHISNNGKYTLNCLINLIPKGTKARIDNTFSSIRKTVRSETLITSDFTPESENEYMVSCKVQEDSFSLIDLNIAVGSKKDARTICENWKKYSQDIYPEIIESLTKKREK